MELKTGIDPASLNKVADELEAEAYLEKTKRLEKSMRDIPDTVSRKS